MSLITRRRSHLSTLAAVISAVGVGLVNAQPAPPPADVSLPEETAPAAPEEAPPTVVAPPAPVVAPQAQATEVAPASPPEAKVAEKPAEAQKRTRSNIAIIQALDKVTAESIRFEAEVGKPVRYKSLIFTVKACERAAPDEAFDDSMVYLTIDSQPRAAPGKPAPPPRQAFRGWMYASSPGLNPLEHPVYDAWVITCKAPAPVVAVTPPVKLAKPAVKAVSPPPAAPAPAPLAPPNPPLPPKA